MVSMAKLGNYAFVDGTNLHLSAKYLAWEIDWTLLRKYLQKRHNVTTAYYFIGDAPKYVPLHASGVNPLALLGCFKLLKLCDRCAVSVDSGR